jgi:hypothetical protein
MVDVPIAAMGVTLSDALVAAVHERLGCSTRLALLCLDSVLGCPDPLLAGQMLAERVDEALASAAISLGLAPLNAAIVRQMRGCLVAALLGDPYLPKLMENLNAVYPDPEKVNAGDG